MGLLAQRQRERMEVSAIEVSNGSRQVYARSRNKSILIQTDVLQKVSFPLGSKTLVCGCMLSSLEGMGEDAEVAYHCLRDRNAICECRCTAVVVHMVGCDVERSSS